MVSVQGLVLWVALYIRGALLFNTAFGTVYFVFSVQQCTVRCPELV